MTYKIEKQIDSYLNGNYPFALMINGEWGSGKTYYLENNLKTIFSKQFTKNSCFYVSANGIKSIDELKNKIVFNNRTLITKEIVTAISKKLKVDTANFATLNPGDLLIIDDIERRHSSLSLEELLGFVSSSFTELNDVKVILVADETELLKVLTESETENYKRKKEKTIYRTIDFNEDLSELINSIIENLNDTEYKVFLKEKSEFILSRFMVYEEKNLRTIGFFIDSLRLLFHKFGPELKLDIDNVIVNTLLLGSIQYKSGISFYTNKELKDYYKEGSQVTSTRDFFQFSEGDEPSEYEIENDKFSRRFFNSYQDIYFCFESLFQYIENGAIDDTKFKQEYKEFCKRYDKNLPWILSLSKLKFYLNFDTDDDFKDNFKIILDNIDKYNISQLQQLNYYCEKILKDGLNDLFDKKLLFAKLNGAIKQCKEIGVRYSAIDYFKIKEESEEYSEFYNTSERQIYEILKIQSKQSVSNLLDKFKNELILSDQDLQCIFKYGDVKEINAFADHILSTSRHLNQFIERHWKNLKFQYSLNIDDKLIFQQGIDNLLDRLLTLSNKKIIQGNQVRYLNSIVR